MDPNLPISSSTSRKVKFSPKGPPRRKKQSSVQPKSEEDGNEDRDDNEAAEAILRKVNERLTRQKPKTEKKVEVTFAHGVASPSSIKTSEKPRVLTVNRDSTLKDDEFYDEMDIDSLPTLPSSTGSDLAETLVNNSDFLLKTKKKEYKEPWDYHHSNYPITLPLRRPYAGDPEILNEAEFGEAAANAEYDEKNIHPASELSLLVSPGVECSFAQDVVAINTAEKQCCQLGELGKRAVVTPDVDFLLNNLI
ncbi:unnamed protein product [Withania somnifera]